MDKEILSANAEIADLSGKMAEFKTTMMQNKEENKREKEMLSKELKFQEVIIKNLVPASVEKILTSMIDWDEGEEKWDLNARKKTKPRFDKPFSVHGVKRPTAMSRRDICEYQNFFLLKKDTINFHLDKELNTKGIFNDDEFLQTQMSKSNTVLDANFLDEKQVTLVKEKAQKDSEIMETEKKRRVLDSPAKEEFMRKTGTAKTGATMVKAPVKKEEPKEEEFPEARGKFGKKRPMSRIA